MRLIEVRAWAALHTGGEVHRLRQFSPVGIRTPVRQTLFRTSAGRHRDGARTHPIPGDTGAAEVVARLGRYIAMPTPPTSIVLQIA
jgi:hypothetical protein